MLALFVPGPIELLVMLFIVGVMFVVTVVPFWFICEKAGFPAWYALATLIPFLAIALLFFLAFSDWPALRGSPERKEGASP